MIIRSAAYVASYPDVKKCPAGDKSEFAFIGRSNVGKSSLINFLTGYKSLAKTSSNPGKTQTLNFFLINELWYLVDMPGYGYAKVSKLQKQKWSIMIKNYLIERENLLCVFQLIDASLPPQKIDVDFTNWMGEHAIPFILIFTKSDKKNRSEGQPFELYKTEMLKYWDETPDLFVTSVKNNLGKKEILDCIEKIMNVK